MSETNELQPDEASVKSRFSIKDLDLLLGSLEIADGFAPDDGMLVMQLLTAAKEEYAPSVRLVLLRIMADAEGAGVSKLACSWMADLYDRSFPDGEGAAAALDAFLREDRATVVDDISDVARNAIAAAQSSGNRTTMPADDSSAGFGRERKTSIEPLVARFRSSQPARDSEKPGT